MDVRIGNLRSVVVVEQNTPTSLTAGSKDSWSTLGTTRGYMTSKGSASRNDESGEIEYHNTNQLIIRYNPVYDRTDLRMTVDGRKFMIGGVEYIEEGRKNYLKFSINEKRG
jgi:hypothetical protein